MRTWILVVVLLAVAGGGCKKDKKNASGTSVPKPPASTVEQDALWALAPDHVAVGIVISPQGVGRIQNGMLDLKALLDSAPDLAPFKGQVDEALDDALGTTDISLATAGLSPTKGFALFAVDQAPPIVILPVGDRDKFLAVTHGTKGATPNDPDMIKKATCKTIKNVYACAKDTSLFERMGKGSMKDQLALAGARGDIEAAAVIPSKQPVTVAAVAQLDRGTVVVRGAVKGAPPEAKAYLVNLKPRVDKDRTSGFMLFNLQPIAQQMAATAPHQEVFPGVFIDELVRSVNGPLTMTIANGSQDIDARLPVADTAAWQKVIDQCTTLPPLKMLGATTQAGTCHVPVPQMMTSIDVWTEGKEVRIGNKSSKGGGTAAPLSAVGEELASTDWMFALYGRGTLLGGNMPGVGMPAAQLPPEAMLGIRALTLVNELGFGVKADGDTIRFVASIRTVWANPDDVTKKLLAIPPGDVVEGKASAAAKAIADGAPGSAFAGDFAAGYGGLMVPAAGVGAIAGVAAPAFMAYMAKSQSMNAMPPTQAPTDVAPSPP